MRKPPDKPFHRSLPIEAQRMLRRAAETPITEQDPLARRRAVDRAIERVQMLYPNHFKHRKEPHNG